MKVFRSVKDFQFWRKTIPSEKSIGFVPTMGALHQGHVSLLRKSKNENDLTVLSIFVNPTQFNQLQDFENYPKTLEQDIKIATEEKIDVLFLPETKEMYADNYRLKVVENDFSYSLCGANRPHHFNGVLTIVLKLFNITKADRSYFGEKDYQQLSLIKDMVNYFFLPITIVSCPTIRESSGLAMSSRNKRLSPSELEKSSVIFQSINNSKTSEEAAKKIEKEDLKVEYIVDFNHRRYAAVQVGAVRLIDNVEI